MADEFATKNKLNLVRDHFDPAKLSPIVYRCIKEQVYLRDAISNLINNNLEKM
jgi:hypothetical protein